MNRLLAMCLTFALTFSVIAAADNPDEACIRSKLNTERTSRGIPALRPDSRLDVLASMQSAAMAEEGTIFHNRDLATQAPAFAALGENVGMGPTCASIHAALMASPGHRANILDRDYTYLGMGVEVTQDAESSSGEWLYVTQVFFRPASAREAPEPPPQPRPKPRPRCTCPS